MTLSIGLDAALSGLSTTADQTSIVSRNVARAGEPSASRKIANLVTLQGGGVKLASVTRAANAALYDKLLGATSDAAAQQAIVDALTGSTRRSTIPSSTPRRPRWSASSPMPSTAMRLAAGRGRRSLRGRRRRRPRASAQRRDAARCSSCAPRPMPISPASVGHINTLLARFETVNAEIVKGTRQGADVTDLLDQRDQILAGISEEVGVRTVSRGNNDMAVYTDSGVTLFDVKARAVTFDRTLHFSATTTGNAVYVDGVPITGKLGPHAGRIGAPDRPCRRPRQRRRHLPEPARRDRARPDPGLCRERPERDPDAARRARTLHLCRRSGDAAVRHAACRPCRHDQGQRQRRPQPRAATRPGFATAASPAIPAYVYNASGASGLTQRLEQLLDALDTQQAFDAGGAGWRRPGPCRLSRRPRSRGSRRRASPQAPTPTTRRAAGTGLGRAVQGHRRQPRRGDDAAARAGALLSGLHEAGHRPSTTCSAALLQAAG